MSDTAPDFRALCAALVKKLDELNCNFDIPSQSALIECANDALATTSPEPPADEEPFDLWQHWRLPSAPPLGGGVNE
jgi:hypothetical protein